MAQAFDTPAAADRIEASGPGGLVTKADLKAELAAIETRLTLRTAIMLGICTFVVAGLPKLLP